MAHRLCLLQGDNERVSVPVGSDERHVLGGGIKRASGVRDVVDGSEAGTLSGLRVNRVDALSKVKREDVIDADLPAVDSVEISVLRIVPP